MGRVKLKFPDEKPLFTATIPVRIGDVNYGRHVGHDAILSIVHEARMQLLATKGWDEMNAGGVALIMADVMLAYKGESFYGDILTVDIYTEDVTGFSFDLLYRVRTMRNEKVTDIAHAKTGMVCFDYAERRIAGMTEELRALLKAER